jgi:hypothetical protein
MILQGLSRNSVILLIVNFLMAIAVFVVIVLTETDLGPKDKIEPDLMRESRQASAV